MFARCAPAPPARPPEGEGVRGAVGGGQSTVGEVARCREAGTDNRWVGSGAEVRQEGSARGAVCGDEAW